MRKYFILLSHLIAYQYMYSKTDTISVLSRFRFGIYVMANNVTSPDKEIIKYHTKEGNNILGTGITYGVNGEFILSDRRAIRFSVLLSNQFGKTQIMEDANLPFAPNSPIGNYYYLTVNESRLEFPLTFKYVFLKQKYRISPYLLVGYSLDYTKWEYIYVNAGCTCGIEDHITINRKWLREDKLILLIGLNYSINSKMNIYLEPLFRRTGGYLGYDISSFGFNSFNYWGLGLGINYKF